MFHLFPVLAMFCTVILLGCPLSGQSRVTDHNAHGWFNYFGDHPVGDSRWGIYRFENRIRLLRQVRFPARCRVYGTVDNEL